MLSILGFEAFFTGNFLTTSTQDDEEDKKSNGLHLNENDNEVKGMAVVFTDHTQPLQYCRDEHNHMLLNSLVQVYNNHKKNVH